MALSRIYRKFLLSLVGIDGKQITSKIFAGIFEACTPVPCIGATLEDIFNREWVVKDLRISAELKEDTRCVKYTYVLALKTPDL